MTSASQAALLKLSKKPVALAMPRREQFAFLRKDFLAYLQYASEQGEPIICLRPLPWMPIYLLTDPCLARDTMMAQGREFHKSKQTRFMVGKFLGSGLVLSEDKTHKQDRAQMTPLFRDLLHVERVKHTTALHLGEELSHVRVGTPIDVHAFCHRLAFTVIVDLIFGSERVSLRASDVLYQALAQFAEAIEGRFKSIPLPAWVPTQRNRMDKVATAAVDTVLKQYYEKNQLATFAGHLKVALEGSHQSAAFAAWRDQIVTMLFAGHETVAKLMAWSLVVLGTDVSIQERVASASASAQDDTTIIDSFLREVLRLYPPVWVFDRSPKENAILGDFHLPKHCKVYISPFVFHRDKANFTKPEEFLIDRFSRLNGADKHPAFMPFGLGMRSCIGQEIAMTEAKELISTLLRTHRIHVDGVLSAIKPRAGATLGFADQPMMTLLAR